MLNGEMLIGCVPRQPPWLHCICLASVSNDKILPQLAEKWVTTCACPTGLTLRTALGRAP